MDKELLKTEKIFDEYEDISFSTDISYFVPKLKISDIKHGFKVMSNEFKKTPKYINIKNHYYLKEMTDE